MSALGAEEAPAPPQVVLAPAAVQRVAGAGDNVFHALQTLPGVSATEDWGSRLSVRGGGPDQNLTVMDGVEIHNPYRLFGITSAFNPEITDRFELTAGGFGAKYGDRLSSILLVDNRQGTTTRRLAVVGDLVVHRLECRRSKANCLGGRAGPGSSPDAARTTTSSPNASRRWISRAFRTCRRRASGIPNRDIG